MRCVAMRCERCVARSCVSRAIARSTIGDRAREIYGARFTRARVACVSRARVASDATASCNAARGARATAPMGFEIRTRVELDIRVYWCIVEFYIAHHPESVRHCLPHGVARAPARARLLIRARGRR